MRIISVEMSSVNPTQVTLDADYNLVQVRASTGASAFITTDPNFNSTLNFVPADGVYYDQILAMTYGGFSDGILKTPVLLGKGTDVYVSTDGVPARVVMVLDSV